MRTVTRLAMLEALCLLAGMGIAQAAFAQAEGATLLKGKDVTEERVLDALTPPAAESASEPEPGVRTRGIRLSVRNSASEGGSKAPKRPSAALLITFETNSAVLTAHSRDQLDVVAAALRNEQLKDFRFEVEGHADLRGTPSANLALSQQRAEAARDYLVNVRGIPEARLHAVGKGDTEPMNLRDVAAPENRRIAITTLRD